MFFGTQTFVPNMPDMDIFETKQRTIRPTG